MEVQLLNSLLNTFPNVALSMILLFFVYNINTSLVDLQNHLNGMDREIEYLKTKIKVLQESLDKIKEDSIRTTVEASTLKERLDRAGIRHP